MTVHIAAHILAGSLALIAGAAAIAARKGGPLHIRAGQVFVAAMLALWISATILHVQEGKPSAAVGDIFIGYFVGTSWAAARRRDGAAGRLQIAACAVILVLAAVIAWRGFTGPADATPVGRAPLFILAGACALAGVLDLHAILRAPLPWAQRISRHLWRMCAAFFIATGSFFLGQQDVMPEAVRGSPALLALAFAPFAAMAFWLAWLRLGKVSAPQSPA